MHQSFLDFAKISKAISFTMETVSREGHYSEKAILKLQQANEELTRALSFSASFKTKVE